jgi:alkanesulfonate monooxygenase SsuD/methylene tetrahydromethanopterin reductase-like flavin-dependent oxidoreductase (luciferase family)
MRLWCVAHQSPGLWTHPRDRADRYNTLEYWVELAKLLECGKFDALFLADVLGVYDVYRRSADAAIANAVQVPVNDPLLPRPAVRQSATHSGRQGEHSGGNRMHDPNYLREQARRCRSFEDRH